MTNLIKIHDVETNEVIEREMTADELAQSESDAARAAAKAESDAARAAAKAVIYERLGITADEAKLLLS